MKMNDDLNLDAYDYELPKELIAERPALKRDASKLLIYLFDDHGKHKIIHTTFCEIYNYLEPQDVLVLNETKVYPARFIGQKMSGGKCEIFLLSMQPKDSGYSVLINSNGKKKVGDKFVLGELQASIQEVVENGTFNVTFNKDINLETLKKTAKIPIPPYIRNGNGDERDENDYQTVYAKNIGSVAAPTAGLHFTEDLFDNIKGKGIEIAKVNLHVGMGTFAPVKSENILEHKMHSEEFFIEDQYLRIIQNNIGNLIAVGTTSLRALESSKDYNGGVKSTDIFLYPGKKIHSIKGIVTNFHLPKSSLIMLISAFIGRQRCLDLYQIAIQNKYRFYSYGDAMLCLRCDKL